VILFFVGAPAAEAQTVHFYLGQEINFYIETTQTPNSTINFTVTQSPSGIVGFSLTSDPYTETLVVPVTTNGSGYGVTYFNVKAVDVGQTTYSACSPGGCTNNLTFKVATVGSIEITEIDSPISDNPSAGAGKRIYPDRTTPGDLVNRKRVRIVVTTEPLVAAATIYLKSFDLDDPSANSNPIDTNASAGDDNRGSPQAGTLAAVGASGTSNTLTLTADGSGVARADFTVTMHPGDNFMIAASVDEAFLIGLVADGGNLRDASGNSLPVTKAKASLMLTVWRKFHLEVDRMGNVGTGNKVQGTIAAVTQVVPTCPAPNVPPTCWTPATVYQVTGPALEVQRFNNGRITIGNKTFDVWENNATHVVIKGIASGGTGNSVLGKAFNLYDDDDYNDDDTQKDGDNGENVLAFADSFEYLSAADGNYTNGRPRNMYASAYIMPEYNWAAGAGFNQTNLQFELNVEDGVNFATVLNVVNRDRNSSASERDDFWVGYVLIGYQGPVPADFDGLNPAGTANENARLGRSTRSVAPRQRNSELRLLHELLLPHRSNCMRLGGQSDHTARSTWSHRASRSQPGYEKVLSRSAAASCGANPGRISDYSRPRDRSSVWLAR
jgi:hypothetical protein